jgi:hypothetical protein
MADETFGTNLLRCVVAELYFSALMQASRELHGKSYFALGQVEKLALDQMVLANIGALYQTITPAWLATSTAKQPMGFQAPTPPQKPES